MVKHINDFPAAELFYFLDNFMHGCELHSLVLDCMDGVCSGMLDYTPKKGIVEDANTNEE